MKENQPQRASGRTDAARMKAILTLTAAIFFAASPFVSGAFGGFRPDQFPIPQDNPPVQPAGYAFSIWGLIYLWLIVSAVYGLFHSAEDPAWDRTRLPLILSLGVGAGWIAVALASPVWATILIWFMLITALWAFLAAPMTDRWVLRVPLALYAGWLTAASSVSIGLLGAGYGIAMGQVGWAIAAILLALVIAVLILRASAPAPEYAAALVWALIAVAVANGTAHLMITGLALLGAAALVALSLRKT
ncbi:MAG: hypothetical protein AAGF74_07405 [Pseudomonadota bacterium]